MKTKETDYSWIYVVVIVLAVFGLTRILRVAVWLSAWFVAPVIVGYLVYKFNYLFGSKDDSD